jgi:hypothetical protein
MFTLRHIRNPQKIQMQLLIVKAKDAYRYIGFKEQIYYFCFQC